MYVESPYVRMRKEIAERKYVRMWNRLGGNVLFPVIATSPDRTRYPWHVVANYALSAVIATSPDSRSKMFTFPW